MTNYAHDENNNRIETLSKEQVYALLAAAIQQGQLPVLEQDTAFVTMIKSIVDGKAYKIGFCTQAQYNELEAQGLLETDALYYITDDSTLEDIETFIDEMVTNLQSDIANKVSKRYEGEDETQELRNDQTGLYLKHEYDSSHAPISRIKVDAGTVEIYSSSSNNGEDDYTYESSIEIKYDDIIVKRDLGEGAESQSLFKHLYRHDILWEGGSTNIVFSLYTTSAQPITVATLQNYIAGTRIAVSGWAKDPSDNQEKRAICIYIFLNNYVAELYGVNNATLGSTDGTSSYTFSDTVTQVY